MEPTQPGEPIERIEPAVEPSSPPAPPQAPRAGTLRSAIIIGVIVAFLAVVLFVVRNNVPADDLKVGDCFDVPDKATISTVEHHACTESHGAEVIHIVEYTGDTSSYPISLTFDRFAEDQCEPAFETYVGADLDARPELSIGYFYPSSDGWSSGDRTVTCYVTRTDDSPMTTTVKAP